MTLRTLGTNTTALNNAFAGALTATSVKTGAYTAAVGDLVPVDASSGAVTIALPSAPADKARVAVKKIDASANAVTVQRGGTSDVFNKAGGSTSLTLSLPNQALGLQYQASTGIWFVVSDDLALSQLDTRFGTTGEVRSKAKADGTDQTAVLQAELNALYDAGGGTLVIPSSPLGAVPIKVTNLTLKNDGATPATMPAICLRGQGMHWSGRGTVPQGGTIIEFTGTDTYGLLKTNALGALVLDGITFRNTTTANSTPFVYTTNTTILARRCAFYGAKAGTACDQDAFILGGINQVEGGSGWTDGFQGYGTDISDCFFSGIRRPLVMQAFANGVRFEDNTIWSTCGNSAGAAVEIDGTPGTGGQSILGGSIARNLFEVTSYLYAVNARNAVGVSILSNDCYDAGSSTVAAVHLESTAIHCNVTAGSFSGSKPYLIDDSGSSTYQEINASGFRSVESKDKVFRGLALSTKQGGIGVMAATALGSWGYVKAKDAATFPYSGVYLASRPPTQVTDGVTTSGSRTVTSATAAFVSSDKDLPIGGTGIPNNATISKVVNSTTVEISAAATATATGVTLNIGRTGNTETLQVLFDRSHLIAQGTAPATGAVPSGITSVTITGRDMGGSVTVVAAGSPPAAGAVIANINHNVSYYGNQHVVLTPKDAATAALGPCWAKPSSNNAWQIGTGATALTASATYNWSYQVIQAG